MPNETFLYVVIVPSIPTSAPPSSPNHVPASTFTHSAFQCCNIPLPRGLRATMLLLPTLDRESHKTPSHRPGHTDATLLRIILCWKRLVLFNAPSRKLKASWDYRIVIAISSVWPPDVNHSRTHDHLHPCDLPAYANSTLLHSEPQRNFGANDC